MRKNILLIAILVIIDQIIKILVFQYLKPIESVTLIEGVLSLTYLPNLGAAFGLWNNRWVLVGVNILVIIVIIKLLTSKKYEFTKQMKLAYSLILAGGIANLVDRIFRGFVIDYIDITNLFEYPIFNLADICIVIGVIVIMITVIIKTVQSQEKEYEKVSNRKRK